MATLYLPGPAKASHIPTYFGVYNDPCCGYIYIYIFRFLILPKGSKIQTYKVSTVSILGIVFTAWGIYFIFGYLELS